MSNIVLHEKYEKEKRSENMQEKALLKRYKSFFIHTKLKCDFDQILQLLIIFSPIMMKVSNIVGKVGALYTS